MAHTHDWIHAASLTTDLEDGDIEDIIEQLIELLKLSGKVTDENRVAQDIMHREQLASTAIEDDIDVPHALTTGVSDFCFSAGVVHHKKIYMLIAWNESNTKNLRQLASLLEAVKNAKEAILAAHSGDEICHKIESALIALGVN